MSEILIKEINEQPHIIQNLIDSEYKEIKGISDKIKGKFNYALIAARRKLPIMPPDMHNIYLVLITKFRSRWQPLPCNTVYNKPPKLSDALVIGISQSGQSSGHCRGFGKCQEAGANYPLHH